MVRVFMLADDTMARGETEAQAVLNVEMLLATASTGRADLSDSGKRENVLTFADFQKFAPDFNFAIYFKHLTAPPVETLNATDSDFFRALDGLLASVPADSWKSYFRWHL